MDSVIRKLEKDEIQGFVEIVVNAYPAIMQQTDEFKKALVNKFSKLQEHDQSIDFFGLFREGKLLGGMRIHYFTLNLFGKWVEAGGVGLVAVDLLHKKEKVAKELMKYFLAYFKQRGVSLVMLYPFNPEFYKKMGFGYGTRMNQYNVLPSSFPKAIKKEPLVFLDQSYMQDLKACYNRYAEVRHGMVLKTDSQIEAKYQNPNQKRVGYMDEGVLRGYILFHFKKSAEENFLINDMVISEMIYENPEALAQLCHFIHCQADQIRRVTINTQDDSLEFLLRDPRNGAEHLIPSVYHEVHKAGIGLMYRIVDLKGFLKEISDQYFKGLTYKIRLKVHDSFVCEHPQEFTLAFDQGVLKPEFNPVSGEADVELKINISELSSLLMGVVDVKKLYQYGLLKINRLEALDVVHQIFYRQEKPICTTAF